MKKWIFPFLALALNSCGPKDAPENDSKDIEESVSVDTIVHVDLTLPENLEPFRNLAGRWEEADGDNVFLEEWSIQNGRLEGFGVALSKGDTTFKEQVFIESFGNYFTYVAIAGNQPPILFTGKKLGEGSYVFENPEHDFPQRIIYTWKGNELTAVVEGIMEGQPYSETILMKRR